MFSEQRVSYLGPFRVSTAAKVFLFLFLVLLVAALFSSTLPAQSVSSDLACIALTLAMAALAFDNRAIESKLFKVIMIALVIGMVVAVAYMVYLNRLDWASWWHALGF